MDTAKRKKSTSQDVDDYSIIYAFEIPNQLAEKFEKLVKENGQTECEVLASLVAQWLNNN